MTENQTLHATAIAAKNTLKIHDKYKTGQAEHGGDLWRKPLIGELDQEITDLVIYAATIKDQLGNIRDLLTELETDYSDPHQSRTRARIRDAIRLLE
jgi:hypothetical protein